MFELIKQLAKKQRTRNVSGERSHNRKRTWAAETFVHCKNNPQQTMTSLSTDITSIPNPHLN